MDLTAWPDTVVVRFKTWRPTLITNRAGDVLTASDFERIRPRDEALRLGPLTWGGTHETRWTIPGPRPASPLVIEQKGRAMSRSVSYFAKERNRIIGAYSDKTAADAEGNVIGRLKRGKLLDDTGTVLGSYRRGRLRQSQWEVHWETDGLVPKLMLMVAFARWRAVNEDTSD